MLFYITLFLIFLYFKIARVHKKEEKTTLFIVTQYVAVGLSTFFLYNHGFQNFSILAILSFSFIFFITVALMVTTVQLGIFIDGKPLFGINRLFKLMPTLTASIAILASITII